MRQISIHGVDDVRMDEAPEPEAGPRDVVVRITACGICGTDLAFAKAGAQRDGEPMPLGHEAAGVIVQAGAQVTGVAPGQRVVINPMNTEAVIGNGGPEGAFCDRLLVREAELGRTLFPIPSDLPDSVAALVEPLSVARHAVNRADPKPHETAVLFGAGPIGLGAVVWLKRRGVKRLIVVDLNEGRLARAKALGATHVIQAGGDLAAALGEICGTLTVQGAPAVDVDVFIDAAGAPKVIADVVAMSKRHARLVVVAVHHAPVPIDFRRMLLSELSITTSIGYPTELGQVLADLSGLEAEAEILISHRFPFEHFFEAFETAKRADCAKVIVEFETT